MNAKKEQNNIVQEYQKSKMNESLDTKIVEISNSKKEKNPKEIKLNLEQEEIPEKAELAEENPLSKEQLNKNCNNKDDIQISQKIEETNERREKENKFLVLNSYWIEFLGSISLVLSLTICECLLFIILGSIVQIINFNGNVVGNIIQFLKAIFVHFGFKWFFFIAMSQHLSVGFFCLTTFSDIFRETKHVIKYFILNFMKFCIYYTVTVIIIEVILKEYISNYFHNNIKKLRLNSKKVDLFFDNLVDALVRIVQDFLSTFNFFLEKIIFGSMYIFLFSNPKCLEGKNMFYFRLMAIIPVIYVIISLILRALYNFKIIEINIYILPFLLASKITVYFFFISTLSYIKFKSLKNEVFDEEHEIEPKFFTKIGSRNFGILGIIEMIIGLFLPSWSPSGIGGKYLLVLCAPIMTLYDYKKKYEIKFPCCKKGNMSLCIKIVFLIIGWFVIIVLGIVLSISIFRIFSTYISAITKFIKNNNELSREILKFLISKI